MSIQLTHSVARAHTHIHTHVHTYTRADCSLSLSLSLSLSFFLSLSLSLSRSRSLIPRKSLSIMFPCTYVWTDQNKRVFGGKGGAISGSVGFCWVLLGSVGIVWLVWLSVVLIIPVVRSRRSEPNRLLKYRNLESAVHDRLK